jgi:drug/metabolite transporter (DMT)-like permease
VRRPRPTLTAALALVLVTASWGSTFPLLKDVVTRVPVPDFLAVRFAVAALVLVALRPAAVLRLTGAERRHGALLGVVYGVAQILQTVGLQHTSASVSGFVTGMYVVFTPLFAALLLRQRVGAVGWLAVAIATVGLAVLSLRGFTVGRGELLTLASAALYAVHIVGLGAWASTRSAFGLTVVQMVTISVVCGAAAVPGGIALPQRSYDWVALVYAAVVAGALALVLQTWAQAHLPPARAAVIMTMEPVWASVFAVAAGGESVTVRLVVGGALVLVAMYVAELAPRGTPETAERVGAVPHVGPV